LIPLNDMLLFAGAALLMVLTPGPNMIYLISRSICQGRKAGVISLLGVIAGFLVHMFAAALGLTALFLAVPFAPSSATSWASSLRDSPYASRSSSEGADASTSAS